MKHLPTITLALLCAASLALAGQGKGRGGPDNDERGPRMEQGMGPGMQEGREPPFFADLGLGDAQKAQLKAHHDKNQEAMIDMRAGLQKAEMRLRQALEAQPIDEAKLKAAREDLVKYQTQQIDMRIAHMRYFLSVLTPEQRKKFDASMPEMGPGMGKGMGRHHEGKGKRK